MKSNIVICGEAYGAEEEIEKFPFVGVSGIELLWMLSEAGILSITSDERHLVFSNWHSAASRRAIVHDIWLRQPVLLTNVFSFRPVNNDIETLCCSKSEDRSGLPPIRTGKYVRAEFLPELDRLRDELTRAAPNVVIALGGTASWALLHNSFISKIRGTVASSVLGNFKVLPAYHPAAILRQWDLRAVTVLDLIKARRESDYPEIRRPKRLAIIEPELSDIEAFYFDHILSAKMIAPDIETAGDQITCIGFATSVDLAIVIPFTDPRKPGGSYWSSKEKELEAWRWVRKYLASPAPKVFQNGMYDISFLWRTVGIPVNNATDDTMLLHHALQPESPKGLDFLGSVYTNEQSWKLMRHRGKTTIKRDE